MPVRRWKLCRWKAYWKADEAECALYWQLIEVENAILAYPAMSKSELIAKAKWVAEKDWTEPENCEVFEYLLKSYQTIAEIRC